MMRRTVWVGRDTIVVGIQCQEDIGVGIIAYVKLWHPCDRDKCLLTCVGKLTNLENLECDLPTIPDRNKINAVNRGIP